MELCQNASRAANDLGRIVLDWPDLKLSEQGSEWVKTNVDELGVPRKDGFVSRRARDSS